MVQDASEGSRIRDYSWCCICSRDLPKGERLSTHLRKQHQLDLIPGCPECCHYRERTGDVAKHALAHHGVAGLCDRRESEGFKWGLTRLQSSYKGLSEEGVVEYPRAEEKQTRAQRDFVETHKSPEHRPRIKKTPRQLSPKAKPQEMRCPNESRTMKRRGSPTKEKSPEMRRSPTRSRRQASP